MTRSKTNVQNQVPRTAHEAAERAIAAEAARRVWARLWDIGVIRPGMRLHDPLGVWWGVGGPPLDVVAAVLLDTLGVATDAPFYPLPDETVEEVARRWLLESHGTEWYDPMHEIPISTE